MAKENLAKIPDEILSKSRLFATAGMQRKEYASVMEQLHQEYRTVLSLRFINGLTPEETSQVMGRSIVAVRVLQHRALTAFRKLMPQQGFEM
jgi:DNA-directed RNA polymerase specialized sigma24 family protein